MKDKGTLSRTIWLGFIVVMLLLSRLAGCTTISPMAMRKPPDLPLSPTHTARTVSRGVAVASVGQEPSSPTSSPPLPLSPAPAATLTPSPLHSLAPTVSLPPRSLKPLPAPLSAAERQQVFEEVWHTINDYYLYDDFHGLNWDEVHVQFSPMIAAAENNEEFYTLMTEMVSLLGDEHSRFVPPGDIAEEQRRTPGEETHVGIGVMSRMTTDGLLIQQVFPHSPARQARLSPHDYIIAIDGEPCTPTSCRSLTGPDGSQVRLTVARSGEPVRDLVLTRRPVEIHIVPIARWLEGDIAYLSIPSLWISDMPDKVSGALTDMVVEKPMRGLILDLRGNAGGWRNVLIEVLSHFVHGDVGAFYDRHGTTPLVVSEGSGPDLRHLPIVVLIDHMTASYAEVLAAVLQQEQGAYVIGVPSSGNVETIYAYDLTGGGRLWLAQEGFVLRNVLNLEGHGVQPDLLMSIDWASYNEQEDPHILEGIQWIARQK
jgi:carboxyl-terminal processing protease